MSSPTTWPAPLAHDRIDAVVRVPGSKSQTNRMLVLASLSDQPSTIRGALVARDTELMAQALRALGVEVGAQGSDWTVLPQELKGPAGIDCGLAGNVMRFGTAIAGLAHGAITFDGDPAARVRPLEPLLRALVQLGVELTSASGQLPVTVTGHGHIRGGSVEIDSRASSQFLTALLLAGSRFDQGLTVTNVGARVPSLAHVEMTLAALRHSSVPVTGGEGPTWRVEPAVPRFADVSIEPDLSNALPFFAAALITDGRCQVPGLPVQSVQPTGTVTKLLQAFGASVTVDSSGMTVRGQGSLHGVDLDMSRVGELVPTATALAALARSPSRIRGVAHLRGHETDRLAALSSELSALGGDVVETEDGLTINPRPLKPGVFHTYDDHRMATTGALLGLAVQGIRVENVATTSKTLPGFTALWEDMLRIAAA